jgi:RNA polymerase sigma-70 factor (ECF subfamily)
LAYLPHAFVDFPLPTLRFSDSSYAGRALSIHREVTIIARAVAALMGDGTISADAASAFAAQVLPMLDELSRFAGSLTRDKVSAEDLVQETYLRAYRGWRTFALGTDVKAWLFAICRNAHYRIGQREHRHVSVDDADLESLAAGALYASAHQQGLDGVWRNVDLSSALRAAIETLDPLRRSVVQLVDVEDRPYAEVASMLGIPIGTVRSRLFRARRELQELLLSHAQDLGLARMGGADPLPDQT